jgi:hypothetical protein
MLVKKARSLGIALTLHFLIRSRANQLPAESVYALSLCLNCLGPNHRVENTGGLRKGNPPDHA